jgi:DNA-binding CsgD family transcriptional regulator
LKFIFIFWVVVLCYTHGLSQGLIGQNEVVSFTRNQYGAGTQNWAITQDKNNRLYIANNEGLLVYNGSKWQLYPVPNKTILRSLGFGKGGKLYVGAQDEVGFFAPDKVGRLQFTSLKALIPSVDRTFNDVWQLEVVGEEVFFRTDTKIFKLAGEKMTVFPAAATWLSMHKHQENVIAHERNKGLLVYKNNQWQPFIAKEELPSGFFITDIVSFTKDTSLVSTTSNGIYWLIQNKLIPFTFRSTLIQASQHFTSLFKLGNNNFLAGTYYNGVYLITKDGKVVENITAKNKMPNNTVRCIYADKYNTAWAGLDNGLALFTYENAVKQINPPSFNSGAGYDVESLNGDLYFALSTGIQYLPLKSVIDISATIQEPKVIMNGLSWNLSVLKNQLFVGRDDGLFTIQNYQPKAVESSTGYWGCRDVTGITDTSSSVIAAGNYFGVRFFEQINGGIAATGKLENFSESSRYIETDKNSIWISHPYRGIFRVKNTDKSVKLYTEKEGLPTRLDNHVFKINGRVVFATAKGIYEYDETVDKIIKSVAYDSVFGNRPIRYLKEDISGNIWFVQEKMVGVADYSSGKPIINYIPELKNKILSGFENIFVNDSRNVLMGAEAGFYHLDYEKYKESIQPFSTYITQLKNTGKSDSLLFGGYLFDDTLTQNNINIPYNRNSLLFSYAASMYGQQGGVEFSYYLDGFDTDWSSWSTNAEKEYTNLPAGDYVFKIKARRSPSHESSIHQFSFTIRPPWYQTIWAYLLYVLLSAGILYASFKYQSIRYKRKQEARRIADQLKFEETQKQIAYQHQLELTKSEKELVTLQKEKLEFEINHKNAELASTTMNLVQKKEFILKLKSELQQLQKNTKVVMDSPELKKLIKVLSEEEKLDEEWNNFSQHFNSVHGDFLTILKNKFPSLKPHELRLCAYLRMNLSSKEIAPLMSISIRGVEISRYRLRKKLELPTEINLVEYLMSLN